MHVGTQQGVTFFTADETSVRAVSALTGSSFGDWSAGYASAKSVLLFESSRLGMGGGASDRNPPCAKVRS